MTFAHVSRHQMRRSAKISLIGVTAFSLLLSGCGDDGAQQDSPEKNGNKTVTSSSSAAPTAPKTKNSRPSPSALLERGNDRKPIDWQAFLADPMHFLIPANAYPKGYDPRTLSLNERGQAIQDVGRAGVGVSNFPSTCNGAGGRIGKEGDQTAMQMAARGNHSLTLLVIKTEDSAAAVHEWAELNNSCPSFFSKENGVASTVSISPVEVPEVAPPGAVGYRIVTETSNFRGSTTQTQVIYAIPMGSMVIEVMGMCFGGPVQLDEVNALFTTAVNHANSLYNRARR